MNVGFWCDARHIQSFGTVCGAHDTILYQSAQPRNGTRWEGPYIAIVILSDLGSNWYSKMIKRTNVPHPCVRLLVRRDVFLPSRLVFLNRRHLQEICVRTKLIDRLVSTEPEARTYWTPDPCYTRIFLMAANEHPNSIAGKFFWAFRCFWSILFRLHLPRFCGQMCANNWRSNELRSRDKILPNGCESSTEQRR